MNPAYPLIMLLAVGSAAIISRFTQSRLPVSPRDRLLIGVAAFCGAFLAAKLPFALGSASLLLTGGAWSAGGKTIMCGLVGGYFGVELAKWYLHVNVKTGDSFAIPVAVAVGIGRWACFFGGCCYGTLTSAPWGVVFPDIDQLRRHPTQIYESVFHLTMAAILFALYRERVLRGQLIKLYFLSYFVYRFLSEFIRPEARIMLGLTWYQWAAVFLFPLFVWLWIRDHRTMTRSTA